MTNEEALDLIRKKIGCLTSDIDECSSMHCDDCEYDFIETDAVMVEILTMAAVALEKQQPKKVESIVDHTWGNETIQPVCPACDYYLQKIMFIGDGKKKCSYCRHCGQKVRWNGEDNDK